MPKRNIRLMLAPLASGVARVTVPADIELLKAPPLGWLGGCSSVVPWAFTVHGGVAGVPVAAHVAGSLMPAITTNDEVLALKSAVPLGAGNVLWSVIRKRNRVTLPPVVLTNRLRI